MGQKVRSPFGEFEAEEYSTTPDDPHLAISDPTSCWSETGGTRYLHQMGGKMHLKFMAQDPVDASAISFIQAIQVMTNMTVRQGQGQGQQASGPTTVPYADGGRPGQDRMARSGSEAPGAYIDQDPRSQSPVYGETESMPEAAQEQRYQGAEPGEDRSAAAQNQGVDNTYQRVGAHSGGQTRPTRLFDHPALTMPQRLEITGSRYRFETAAVATEGEQAGAWYGSVSWGFRATESGVEKESFELASAGPPTGFFQAASRRWNEGAAPSGGRQAVPDTDRDLELELMSVGELLRRIHENPRGDSAERCVDYVVQNHLNTRISVHGHQRHSQNSLYDDEIFIKFVGDGFSHRSEPREFDNEDHFLPPFTLSDVIGGSAAAIRQRLTGRMMLELWNGSHGEAEKIGSQQPWDLSDEQNLTFGAGSRTGMYEIRIRLA